MDEDDIALRNLACRRFAGLGRAPAAAEIAAVAGLDEAEVIPAGSGSMRSTLSFSAQ